MYHTYLRGKTNAITHQALVGVYLLFATTVTGLEDVAAEEIRSLLGIEAKLDVGKVFFEGDDQAIYRLNVWARTLHRVFLLLARERFSTLDDIYRIARSVDFSEFVDPDQSFAVRAERVGKHPFTSIDVASTVGQAIIDSYLASRGVRLKVDLKSPDVEFYALVREDEFLLGINTTGRSLHKRGYRVYHHPAALRTTIAASMIRLSKWNGKDLFSDPMCGGGTILAEAALFARGIPVAFKRKDFALLKLRFLDAREFLDVREKALERAKREIFPVLGVEKFRFHLGGAAKNLRSAGVYDTVSLVVGDATKLDRFLVEPPTCVVTNPPYGVRMRPGDLRALYSSFLRALKNLSPGGTLVLITAAKKTFLNACRSAKIELKSSRKIFHGDLRAWLFVCEI